MAKYTLVIKKADIKLELSTNDKEFVENELGSWITMASVASENSKETIKTDKKEAAINEETKEILRKAIHEPELAQKEQIKTTDAEEDQDPEESAVSDDFSKVFEEKMSQAQPQESPSTSSKVPVDELEDVTPQPPTNSSVDKFSSIVSSKKINNAFDCLIGCAYHLVERENFERFTLKQINTLSKAIIKNPIEHDTLKEALDKKYIKVVPDYTGTSDKMEYTLTNAGIGYFKDELE